MLLIILMDLSTLINHTIKPSSFSRVVSAKFNQLPPKYDRDMVQRTFI